MITALGIMLVLDIFAIGALTLSASQMTVATQARKGNTAFNVAEAGFNKAIWKVNNVASYAPSSVSPDVGTVQGGSYKVTMSDVAGNSNRKMMTITGYSPDMTNLKAKKRTIQAVVEVAPTVLSYGMYSGGWVDQSGSPNVYFAPLDYRAPGARGADFGSNYEISFGDNGCSYNQPGSSTYDSLFGSPAVPMGNIITAGPNGRVTVRGTTVTTAAQLMSMEGKTYISQIIHTASPMTFPTFDFETPYAGSYKEMAANNTSNGANNSLSGHNGVYTKAEFATMLGKASNQDLTLNGVIYVDGEVTVSKNLTINNGSLICKNTTSGEVALTVSGALRVTHGAGTKNLIGIGLFSSSGTTAEFRDSGTVIADGLVYAETTADLFKGNLTIKGCMLVKMAESSSIASINAKNGTVIIQYDPQVAATNGMTAMGSIFVRRVVSWKEINSP